MTLTKDTYEALVEALESALAELDEIANGWDAQARHRPRDVTPWVKERRAFVEKERIKGRAALALVQGEQP